MQVDICSKKDILKAVKRFTKGIKKVTMFTFFCFYYSVKRFTKALEGTSVKSVFFTRKFMLAP